MQFSAVEIRFIVTTYLNSTFTNDLKRIFFFRKNFIVTDYAALTFHIELSLKYVGVGFNLALLKDNKYGDPPICFLFSKR